MGLHLLYIKQMNNHFRTEQNRTVSLLISGHIHDIEIQCEQQNVIYKGLVFYFSLLNTKLLYR